MQTDVNQNTPPVQGSPVNVNVVAETKPKGLSKVTAFFIVLFLIVLFFGAGAYAGYYFANSDFCKDDDKKYSSEQDEFGIDEIEEKTTMEYLGAFIDAEIPGDWRIEEYMDGEGSDMLVSGATFSGLTGLGIFDEEDNQVFKLYAVAGIGGIELCSSVAQFPDTPQSYIDRINDLTIDYNASTESGTEMPVVVQINEGEYTSFNFFDYVGRRVGSTYYWNDSANVNPSEFHPLCGLSGSFLVFKTLSFEMESDGVASSGYSYGFEVMEGLSDEKLLMLDSVMDSVVLK
jgi:hypothetical protein